MLHVTPECHPQQACGAYEAAVRARPASHASLYNWGVALSDLSRVLKAAASATTASQQSSITPPLPQSSSNGRQAAAATTAAATTAAAAAAVTSAATGSTTPSSSFQTLPINSKEALAASANDMAASRRCLSMASEKYAEAVRLHPNNPQALNNWGLVLQVFSP